MNAFNRVFVIITLAILLVIGAVTLVVPALTLGVMRSATDSLETGFFANFTDVVRVIVRILLALAWIFFMALLLWAEFRRPGSRTIEVARYTGGSAIRISTAAVAEKVQEAVSAASGVIDAKVKATGRNRAVEIRLDVSASKDTDLVQKAEEIATITRQVVQDQLGLKLTGKPEVAIKAKQGRSINFKLPSRNLPPRNLPPLLNESSTSSAMVDVEVEPILPTASTTTEPTVTQS